MSVSTAKGFTLIEVIMVIVILGIIAWIAFPQVSPFGEITLRAAAHRVAADLRYAQAQAISHRQVHGVLFDPVAESYWVYAPIPATPVVDPASRGKTLRVDFTTRTEYRGVTILSASFGTTPGVRFDYFGVPRDTAGVDLAATGRVILTASGQLDTIDVSPETGKVTVR